MGLYVREPMKIISEFWSNQVAQLSTTMHLLPDVQAAQHQHQLSIKNMEHQMAAGVAQVKVKLMDFLKKLKHLPPWTLQPLV